MCDWNKNYGLNVQYKRVSKLNFFISLAVSEFDTHRGR